MMESDKRLDNDNSECGAETEENEGDESGKYSSYVCINNFITLLFLVL
jgi:hypothetical protein